MPTLVPESKTIRHELWTADDFLEWLQPGVHADLIDGEKFMHSPVNLRHADLTNFVDRLLAAYIEKHRLVGLRPGVLPNTVALEHLHENGG